MSSNDSPSDNNIKKTKRHNTTSLTWVKLT